MREYANGDVYPNYSDSSLFGYIFISQFIFISFLLKLTFLIDKRMRACSSMTKSMEQTAAMCSLLATCILFVVALQFLCSSLFLLVFPFFPLIIIKLAFIPVRYTGEWLNGFAHGRGAITFVRVDRDAQEELWVRGVCLRLVPSVSFQLSGHDDEKLASKRSVNSILTTHSPSLTS